MFYLSLLCWFPSFSLTTMYPPTISPSSAIYVVQISHCCRWRRCSWWAMGFPRNQDRIYEGNTLSEGKLFTCTCAWHTQYTHTVIRKLTRLHYSYYHSYYYTTTTNPHRVICTTPPFEKKKKRLWIYQDFDARGQKKFSGSSGLVMRACLYTQVALWTMYLGPPTSRWKTCVWCVRFRQHS